MVPRSLPGLLFALLLPAAAVAAEAEKASIAEQQVAIARLGGQPGTDADRKILALFDQLEAHALPTACWLELFEAAALRPDRRVQARLAAFEAATAESRDALRKYRECLEGGDAARGRAIFLTDPRAGCIRCHRVSGAGGEIGPDLTAVRQATDRVYIIESIVEPNAVVTNGFPQVLLKLVNGEEVGGIAGFESSEYLILTSTTDGKRRRISGTEIMERSALPSAMPLGFGQILGKRGLRDLVEFLATDDKDLVKR